MGIFYTNITLLGPDQKRVADYLAQANRTAYISPTIQNFTVVYDKGTEDQDPATLRNLTSVLSGDHMCKALAALVHDGDIFMYWLYDAGKLVDKYNSTPGYFNAAVEKPLPPRGGDAKKLCAAFNVQDSLGKVQRIFQMVTNSNLVDARPEDYLIGEDIHRELAKVLGIPLCAVETGYYTIENGFLSDEFDRSGFMKTEARE